MSPDTTATRDQLIASLADKEYRDLLVQESINQGIAFQIRANRTVRGWTQGEMGTRAGKAQSEISRYEDPDYESYTLKTLTCLASAFDVALSVRFVPFSDLVNDMSHLASTSLSAPSFSEDKGLEPRMAPQLSIQNQLNLTFAPLSAVADSTVIQISDYLTRNFATETTITAPSLQEDYPCQTTQAAVGR